MKIARALVASTLALVAACGSSSTPSTGSPAPDQDKGLEGPGVAAATSAPDTNPAGVAYPVDNIGSKARVGATPGNRIQNFKFLGYPDASISGGLKPISLAEFFDPTGTQYKIIHLQAAGVWCSACQAETKAVVPIADQLKAKKAIWIVSLAEGPTPGTPSKQADLDGWIGEFKSPYTHLLDPNNANLGIFYDAAALPWNANIDARTMEILTSGTGGIIESQGILDEIDRAQSLADSSTIVKPN